MRHNPAARVTGGPAGGIAGLPMPGVTLPAMFSGMMPGGAASYTIHDKT